MPPFPKESPISDPEEFLRGLGLPDSGPDVEAAKEVLAGHAEVVNHVWEQEMQRRGEDLLTYLNTPEAEGGPGPATDNETARPSPFRGLPGNKIEPEKVE